MVNFAKITVSRLSKLQKLILSELKEDPLLQEILARRVADKHEVKKTERTLRKAQENEKYMDDLRKEHPGFVAALGPAPTLKENYEWGSYERSPILSKQFRATFYRALKRLRERRLIRRYSIRGEYPWGGHYVGTAVMIRPEAREVLESKGIIQHARAVAFRAFYRLVTHQVGQPDYPEPVTWSLIENWLNGIIIKDD